MDIRIVICLLGMSFYCQVAFSAKHESTEMDLMHFYYEPDLHYFIAATHGTCFLVPLTHDEREHVHTDAGIEALELEMMRDWMGVLPETRIFHDDDHLPSSIQSRCTHREIFLLERTFNETSTPVSPLATIFP